MIKVNVIVKDKSWLRYIKNPEKFIRNRIKKIERNSFFNNKKIYYFTLLLSNSKEIKILNKNFRKKNKITDVLSFPYYHAKELIKVIKHSKEVYLGDIIINFQKINESNASLKFKDRFDELWIHALLHLFGFKHKKDSDYIKMNYLEKKFYQNILK